MRGKPETAVGSEARARIRSVLGRLEREHGVRILYACQSGSGAWGFASADGDYDVRFIYARPITDSMQTLESALREIQGRKASVEPYDRLLRRTVSV